MFPSVSSEQTLQGKSTCEQEISECAIKKITIRFIIK
jgi:hypothetical protein